MGSAGASIAFVGEAPGHQEARTGEPFTGPSGKLLDTVLAHYGIDRSEVYVDNVVACRPPGNRTPSKEEIRACYPRLRSELQSRPLESIVTLGNTATQAVLDTRTGITSVRVGPPRRTAGYPDAVVIPTFHPAACLRSADSFPSFVTDIGKLKHDVSIGWEPPTFSVFDEPQLAEEALHQLRDKFTYIVIDIEVGVDKEDMGHADQYDMLCIGFSYAPGKAIVIGENALKDNHVLSALRNLLTDRSKKWIAHNGKFDLAGLYAYGEADLYFDTMLASYALDERPGTHGLKYLAVELLGAPQYDDEVKKYISRGDTYAIVPREVLYRYNAYDVACTWLLYERFERELQEEGLRDLHDFLVRASNRLQFSEMEGIAIDQKYLDELTDTYLESLEVLENTLRPWVANPRSPKQVKEALYDMGFRVDSTNQDTLEHLQERVDPDSDANAFISQMLLHRREQKLYGTYVKGIRKRLHHGRVFPTFLLHGTVTGRLACRNPNLQNVPRESTIRHMYVPASGNVFVQADYSQVELRVAATLSEDKFLREVFNDPTRDLFDEVGHTLYGPDAINPLFRKDLRIRTKAYVYGIGYGREAYSIAMEYRIPVGEAQRGLDAYLGRVPELVAWRDSIKNSILQDQSDLVTRFGRHRRFWLITDDNKEDIVKEGLAYVPQSTASDINLTALCRLRDLGLHVRIPVHDSTLVECSEESAEEVARTMVEVMSKTATEIMGDYVPFPVEVAIGKTWGEV